MKRLRLVREKWVLAALPYLKRGTKRDPGLTIQRFNVYLEHHDHARRALLPRLVAWGDSETKLFHRQGLLANERDGQSEP